ncbi:MAG TPA: hypothetical protein VEW03_09775 [Longimicrobiaceae bacterium]|nr:hypothetical protein [Longimicrobiaceae bacterium]
MTDASRPSSTGEAGRPPARSEREAAHGHDEELVDEASAESFPASDPPAFTHSHAGPPVHADPAPDDPAGTGG